MSKPSDPTQERHDGPTPNGGAYSIAYFLDDHRDPVAKDEATAMEIIEFDADGEQVHRTYMAKPKPDPVKLHVFSRLGIKPD